MKEGAVGFQIAICNEIFDDLGRGVVKQR